MSAQKSEPRIARLDKIDIYSHLTDIASDNNHTNLARNRTLAQLITFRVSGQVGSEGG